MNKFPEQMLEYRAKNNLTQKQLAEKLNVTRETVNQIENGVRKNLRPTLRVKIELLLKGE